MGFPMARRLVEANHRVVAFDTRAQAMDRAVALGAHPASSPQEVADLAETVMASLPSPQVALEVATEAAGVIEGSRVKRYIDLSTIGSQTAVQIHHALAGSNIAMHDEGADSDFTSAIKPIERAAGVTVGPLVQRPPGSH